MPRLYRVTILFALTFVVLAAVVAGRLFVSPATPSHACPVADDGCIAQTPALHQDWRCLGNDTFWVGRDTSSSMIADCFAGTGYLSVAISNVDQVATNVTGWVTYTSDTYSGYGRTCSLANTTYQFGGDTNVTLTQMEVGATGGFPPC